MEKRHIPKNFNIETAMYLDYEDIIAYCDTGMTLICEDEKLWNRKVTDLVERGGIEPSILMSDSARKYRKYYVDALLRIYPDDIDYLDAITAALGSVGTGKYNNWLEPEVKIKKEMYPTTKYIVEKLIEVGSKYQIDKKKSKDETYIFSTYYSQIGSKLKSDFYIVMINYIKKFSGDPYIIVNNNWDDLNNSEKIDIVKRFNLNLLKEVYPETILINKFFQIES